MGVTFPLSPNPSYMDRLDQWGKRSGIFRPGEAITGSMLYGYPTAYRVLDYWGAQVTSGAMSGRSLIVAPPAGGFIAGWYRILFSGSQTDPLFGPSYGGSTFVVIPDDGKLPTNPSAATQAPSINAGGDLILKGVIGAGTSRLSIADATNVNSGLDNLPNAVIAAQVGANYWTDPITGAPDSARPTREMFLQFPAGGYDTLPLAGASGGTWMNVYALSGSVNSANLFITVGSGTTTGSKVTVSYPDSATAVETWDNLTSAGLAQAAINAGSTRVRVFSRGASGPAMMAATAVGRTKWDGVVTVVSTLYPYGVRYYEGPSNEPSMNAETAQAMRLFADAIHAGNSSAKAIGPAPVIATSIEPFLAAGGANWCDAISVHDYNCVVNCDITLARAYLDTFFGLLTKYNVTKPVWQTEAGGALIAVHGIYHPRRARGQVFHDLLWEQYGTPREHNPPWYDVAHGFWAYPCWMDNGFGSLNPQAPMYATLARETFGKNFTTRLDFGAVGDRCFIGNVYQGTAGTTAVIMAASYMAGATVTLSVPGMSGPVTVVDAWGNASTVTASAGQITVSAPELPTYVRLPAGQAITAYTCNDWPAVAKEPQRSRSGDTAGWAADSTAIPALHDGKGIGVWGSSSGFWRSSSLPAIAVATWPSAATFDRVIVWAGQVLNAMSTLYAFTVDISNDGSTWTTVGAVSRSAPYTFIHGCNYWNHGCRWETYWDEQNIFDVPLGQNYTAKYLRVVITDASYGGEPDSATTADGGLGDSVARAVIQDIAVLSDANTQPQFVRA